MENLLLWELEALGALSASQFGFRRFRSTFDPLLFLEQNIRQVVKVKRVLLGVFFDLEKAYDSTWREVFFVNYSTLFFEDSSLYLSKIFYLTAPFKCVLETLSLITMNFKRVYLRVVS